MQSGLLLKYMLVALYRECVTHDFSIELYWLDVNVRFPPDVWSLNENFFSS